MQISNTQKTKMSVTTSSQLQPPTKRIEYIDAMRGFTMMLVVIHHVSLFCLGVHMSDFSYSKVFQTFRMPLFFFVSGLVFFSLKRTWSSKEIWQFIQKKVVVQLITPSIFLLTYIMVIRLRGYDTLCSDTKGGYWFTFALFEYFIIYIVSYKLFGIFSSPRQHSVCYNILMVVLGIAIYYCSFMPIAEPGTKMADFCGFIGYKKLQYFLFFILGAIVKEHFAAFERFISSNWVKTICVILFFYSNIYYRHFWYLGDTYKLFQAIVGIMLVFIFFHSNQQNFSKSSHTGRILQYIGRRTLDIYLIHYFFVMSNMQSILPNFGHLNTPFLEFVVSLFIASLITCACLLVSHIIRVSPFIDHVMFGAKKA